MSSVRVVMNVFDVYQKARISFVQTVSDMAGHANNVPLLENAGALDLLPPLLNDNDPSIRQTAAVALGKLANHNVKMAQDILRKDVLPLMIKNIRKHSKYFKKAAMICLRAVGKHTPEMAQLIVDNGGLDAMIICLEDFDTSVKEAAASAMGSVGRHNRQLAQAVVDAGGASLLVLCLQEPEIFLRQVAAAAICDIAKHTQELAAAFVDCEALPHLVKTATCMDPKPKLLLRQSLLALASIAKHSLNLAEMVVEAGIFPDVLVQMGHPDDNVKKNAAALTREVVKHSVELALMVVNYGGVAALLQLVASPVSSVRIQAIMALGFICAQSEQLAYCVIASHGVIQLAQVLSQEKEDHILAATVWALGQIGRHSPEHSKALAAAGIYPKLLKIFNDPKSSEDLVCKCRMALKESVKRCMDMNALEVLLYDAPPDILQHVIGQFSKILPNDPAARKMFVVSGGLKKMQDLEYEPGSALMEYICTVQACYPEEILRYYSPGYSQILLDRVASYEPTSPQTLNKISSCTMASNTNRSNDCLNRPPAGDYTTDASSNKSETNFN